MLQVAVPISLVVNDFTNKVVYQVARKRVLWQVQAVNQYLSNACRYPTSDFDQIQDYLNLILKYQIHGFHLFWLTIKKLSEPPGVEHFFEGVVSQIFQKAGKVYLLNLP